MRKGGRVLRIHFTAEDLGRVRVLSQPDPMWETVLSIFRLQDRGLPFVFHEWRRAVAPACSRDDLAILRALVPGGYFPDFLTPSEGQLGLDAGIEALLSTPRSRFRAELDILASRHRLPSWTRRLADGDRETVQRLADAIRGHFRSAVEPYWQQARAHIDADRARRARAILDGGTEGLLSSYLPMMRWSSPVLSVDVRHDQDVYLDGRGLLLVPSFISMSTPDFLHDHTLPQVLVYPVEHTRPVSAAASTPRRSLAALIGDTRTAVLEGIGEGSSTTELARRIGVSAASISQHTAVLRSAGLIRTGRVGKAVLHTLTPLGEALLRPGLATTA
ncbi:ArsR/SmtB family transcription factor [Micromonospora eburnea]|uniref:ArsR/SmtB family transcription factor n=1 Tax=Micromonospora eburnea TaxID=227316 RepID=UPI001FC9AC50|nr:winged helix-turn-helix domain-containing protein [Micromonospora eburnea]